MHADVWRAECTESLQSIGTTARNAQRDALITPAVLLPACKLCNNMYVVHQKHLGICRIGQAAHKVPCLGLRCSMTSKMIGPQGRRPGLAQQTRHIHM
jgi:hypothetical protein